MMFLPVEPQQRLHVRRHRRAHRAGRRARRFSAGAIRRSTCDAIGRVARASQPYIEQIFVRGAAGMTQDRARAQALRRPQARGSRSRRIATCATRAFFYMPSLSSRTIVYKGLLLAPQIANFYKELSDPDTTSALCLVHQRFSTNTFPTWQLAHPYPLRLPQRRNQHRARQRQLDERARVGAARPTCSATISRSFSRSFSRAAAIPRRSITRSSC